MKKISTKIIEIKLLGCVKQCKVPNKYLDPESRNYYVLVNTYLKHKSQISDACNKKPKPQKI
jgi:hypothetical protein